MSNKITRVYQCQINRLHRHIYEFVKQYKKYFPNIYDKYRYFYLSGEQLSWNHPIKLNEKLFWLNRYWQPKEKVMCADKVLMHKYLKFKKMSNLSVPLLGTWNNPNDIDFSILPTQFVLKCNHGCGFNIVCTDKENLNKEWTRMKLKSWLSIDYGKVSNERHYSSIKPCILCEEYLANDSGTQIKDYKVYCINGKIEYILVCSERNLNNDDVCFNTYTPDWKELDYIMDEEKGLGETKPEFLVDIINSSLILSAEFPYVRLDFYHANNKLYLGEFTFTPQGNYITYKHEWIQYYLGSKLKLPKKTFFISKYNKCNY